MGSATAVEYEIGTGWECQDTGVCWRLLINSLANSSYLGFFVVKVTDECRNHRKR